MAHAASCILQLRSITKASAGPNLIGQGFQIVNLRRQSSCGELGNRNAGPVWPPLDRAVTANPSPRRVTRDQRGRKPHVLPRRVF